MKSALAASEGALVHVATVVVVLVLQRRQVFETTGVALGWWPLVLPAMLVCLLASLAARRGHLTALPFGANSVFIMAFIGAMGPFARQMCAATSSADACSTTVRGFFSASLAVYATLVALLTLMVLRLDWQGYRRVLLMPLAAICWVYLLVAPAIRIVAAPVSVILPTITLFALLLIGSRGLVAWLASGALWFLLATLTDTFPSAEAVPAETLTSPAFDSVWLWIGRSDFWLAVLPVMAPLAITNAFGILENLMAAREVGDEHSPGRTLAIVTAGTTAAAALGTGAPMTVYVGHAAFQRRSAGWAYGLCALPLLAVVGVLGNTLVARLPTTIFLGAIAYLGVTIGLLPRKYLRDLGDLVRFLVVACPVVVMGLVAAPTGPLAWLARGGALTALGWSFLCFAPRGGRERAVAAALLGAASIVGLVHTAPFSAAAVVTGLIYLAAAIVLRFTARNGATVRGLSNRFR